MYYYALFKSSEESSEIDGAQGNGNLQVSLRKRPREVDESDVSLPCIYIYFIDICHTIVLEAELY